MQKTVSAIAFALLALCVAGSAEARTKAHKASKPAAVKVAAHRTSAGSAYLQCVTFARQFSGVQIFGDAWTWWEKATGRYEEGSAPKPGAVLVFRSQGKMKLGHVAVVSQIITDRYIQVTHANWSPINGRRGQVEDNVNVMDVSEKGDWSKVKVWYGPLNDLGTTVYSTYGFIYQDSAQVRMGEKVTTIAQPEAAPSTARPYLQIASADTTELPSDLKSVLTPANGKAASHVSGKAVTVAAHVSGKPAAELVAQIDSDNAAAGHATAKTAIKPAPKSVKAKSKAQSPSKAKARKHTQKK
ncbi:CHAP domain-containing protein [Asticcacaulis sp.]|uniref:CHAP domain-containing protein n=1 Tax=Asticcacaulis sp. TaxID=1872648 RepID=UPI002CCC2D9C|nr:CHAP domain-containing protein [Asticcacaulis sp.]HTM80904.1 CHAP domain-containing protein [Asticcacaulis sp.]